jgi:hypothetical protein
MWDKVVELNAVVECVWPETWLQVSPRQHRLKSIADSLMRSFARAILMGRIGASQLDSISVVGKRAVDIATLSKLSSAIHANVSIGASRRVVCEPIVDPIHGGSFGSKRPSIKSSTEMISNQNVTCLTVDADEIAVT